MSCSPRGEGGKAKFKISKTYDSQTKPKGMKIKKARKNRTCRKCGLPLSFKKLPNGKWYPLNADDTEHWDICREEQFKQGKIKPEYGEPKLMIGSQYVPAICNCPIPPWEPCDHYHDEEIGEEREHLVSILSE